MGFFGSLIGSDQAKAAQQAAADTYAKQMAAAEQSKQAGSQYLSGLTGLSQQFAPYAQGGLSAQQRVYDLLGLTTPEAQNTAFSAFRTDPGYQFALQQGLQAIDRGAAARGMLNSGRTLKAEQQYGTGLADQTYGNYLQRLMGLGTQGLTATGQQVGTAATGYGGQLNANLTGTQQLYGAAPTIGQGQIAAASARGQGAANILDFGAKGLGFLLGGGLPSFGSFFGGGGQSGGGFG